MGSHTEINRDQLKKILLVALSASEDGEIVAAVKALKNRLKKGGKDIHWFADLTDGHIVPQLPDVAVADWDQQLLVARREIWRLSHREQEFIDSLWRQQQDHGKYWQPSYRQKGWLGSIYRRVTIIMGAGF